MDRMENRPDWVRFREAVEPDPNFKLTPEQETNHREIFKRARQRMEIRREAAQLKQEWDEAIEQKRRENEHE